MTTTPDVRNKPWLIWSGLAVVFLCGLLLGIVSVTTYEESQRQHKWERGLAGLKPRAMKHLTRELNLSAEQQQQIEPILKQAETELLRLRMAQQPRVDEVLDRTRTTLKLQLNPDQQEKLEALYARLQQRWDRDRQYVQQLNSVSAKSEPDTRVAPPDATPTARK